MTMRDRMVLASIAVIAVFAVGWLGVVSPKRKQATKIETQLSEAKTQLSSAESQLSSARTAQVQYAKAYASVVSLGKAVPASQEVPSLMYELSQATDQKHVEFTSIATTGSGSSGSATSTTPAAAAAASTGFSQMPFTFVFNGSFFDLEHLFSQLDRFATRSTTGDLQVSGRLLTIQSVKLAPVITSGTSNGKTSANETLSGSITATAYVLPAGQGLTGGATPASPTGSTSSATSAASTASTASSASSPSAAAVIRVTP